MRYVYDVRCQHRHYAGEHYTPTIIALNIDAARRKALRWLKEKQQVDLRRWRIENITQIRSIDVP